MALNCYSRKFIFFGYEHQSVVMAINYNYALVLFHQRQFYQSERILADLLELKNPPGDSFQFPIAAAGSLLCQRIILLWLEVCLCLQRPQRVFNAVCTFLIQIINALSTVLCLCKC